MKRLESILRNIRYACRVLRKAPGFTLTVVLTLALVIGANSAVFSALDAVLIEPLSFPDSDRLVQLSEVRGGTNESGVGSLRLVDWNRENTTFEAISSYSSADQSDTTGDFPERVRAAAVAPQFFDVWQIALAEGRSFVPADHEFGSPCVRVISNRYRQSRFPGVQDVLGRTIRTNSETCEIVGVLPEDFPFPDRTVDIWFPGPVDAPWQNRTAFLSFATGIGRLRPGVTLEQASADLTLIQERLGDQFPETDREVEPRVVPLKAMLVGGAADTLWLLFGAVSLLLLIACINIASLLLSRAVQREQETALRFSLGASRTSVIGQFLAEAAVLTTVGALLGVAIAVIGAGAFANLAPELPRVDEIGFDVRLMLYTGVTSAAVVILCGLYPAVRGAKLGFIGRVSRTLGSLRQSLQWTLVGAQVTLSVMLLFGALLLVRSFEELWTVDLGFDPESVLVFRMSQIFDERFDLSGPRINGWLDELESLPNVASASVTFEQQPGIPGELAREISLLSDLPDVDASVIANTSSVSPGFFATMGIPILAGDLCRLPEQYVSGHEVMVNRSFVERYLGGRSAIGLQMPREVEPQFGGPATVTDRVVGVVGDARDRGPATAPVPTVYSCAMLGPNAWFLLKTTSDPSTTIGDVRIKLRELAPDRSVYPIAPLQELMGEVHAADWMRTVLLSLFAATALGLASLGIYGTLSYVVRLRRREVGLRVALGARRRNIVAELLKQVLMVVGLASLFGLFLSFALARTLSGMLFGVTTYDPVVMALVLMTVLTIGVSASLVPSLRASRIDPFQALREE